MTVLREQDFLIAIDSDGCVFDSMEVKQKGHFHPLIVRHFGLEALETETRKLAEYVNLHSRWRGSNRFTALLKNMDLLKATSSFAARPVDLPWLEPLRAWVTAGGILDNTTLAAAAENHPALEAVRAWSLAVNADIAAHMAPIPPFPGVRETLGRMQPRARRVVVSLTPGEALRREWREQALDGLVEEILGLEHGPKPDQLRRRMTAGGFSADRVLLIGDAPGDLNAARDCGVSFYPIVPGQEAASWENLRDRDLERFFAGAYAGAAAAEQLARFDAALMSTPPPA